MNNQRKYDIYVITRYAILSFIFAPLCSPLLLGQRHLELSEQTDRNLNEIRAVMEAERYSESITDREYKHFKRWEIAVSPYADRNGNIPNYTARNWKELQRFLHRQSLREDPLMRITHGAWEDVTPGDFGTAGPHNGRLNCVAVHPNDPNTIYIGSAVGGLWVTFDGGTSWTNQTDGLINLGVSGIAIDPTSPNVMYILTGDGDGRHVPSMGVLKSYNGGWDWVPTSLTWDRDEDRYGYKMIMHPDDPSRMYVAANTGVYITTDGWNTYDSELTYTTIRDIDFVPGSPDTLFATATKSVYKSVNGGENWDYLNDNNIGLPYPSDFSRTAVAISPDSPETMYALFGKDIQGQGWGYYELYISQNYGMTWMFQSSDTGVVGNQCWYNFTLTVEPGSPSTVYMGTVNLWKSTDSGNSFTKIAVGTDLPQIHADVHDLLFDGGTLYTASDGGLSKSTDSGASFANLSDGLGIMQFYDIDVLGIDMMGGTQDNGTNRWNLGDATGNHILGGDGFECMYDPSDVNVRYACSQVNRYRWDAGSGWDSITPQTHGNMWSASWVMHPTDYDTIYSAQKDLARSYDRGENWTLTDPGFTHDKTIKAIAQGVNNPNVMYCSDRYEIRRTTTLHNPAPSWSDVTGDLPGNWERIGGIAVDPDNVSHVWVTFRGYVDGYKVFFSDVGGTTWTNISGSLPNIPVHCIAYHTGSNDGLYIGTDFGVFYRNANMSDWIWFANGFPKTRVEDLKVTSGYVYAGTFGRGIWRSSHYTTCPIAISIDNSNDPSPAHTTGVQVFSASSSVVSTQIITGGIGTDVTYNAGNYVLLQPGFHAERNNEFLAKLDGCPE